MPCGAAAWEVDVIGTEGRIRSLNNAEEFELNPQRTGRSSGARQTGKGSIPLARADAGHGTDNCCGPD